MITITHTTRKLPHGRFVAIMRKILGEQYTASLTFIGATRAQRLNHTTRGKTYVPNVLSFPLDASNGEIYICPTAAHKEAKNFGLSQTQYLEYLTIHGCLHLLGHDHGAKMDTLETRFKKQFGIKDRV